MPHPGEATWKVEATTQAQKNKTYIPPGGTAPHYSDSPAMKGYKNIIRAFKKHGADYSGHITFDPKTERFQTLTESGTRIVRQLIAEHEASKTADQPKAEGKDFVRPTRS